MFALLLLLMLIFTSTPTSSPTFYCTCSSFITLAGAGCVGLRIFAVLLSFRPVPPGVAGTKGVHYAHPVPLFVVVDELRRASRPLATPAAELAPVIRLPRAPARLSGPAGRICSGSDRDGVADQRVVFRPDGHSLRPVQHRTPVLGLAVVGQQGRGGRSLDFIRMRGQEVLFKFYGVAAHVGEVAEFAAEVLCVALAVRRFTANADKSAAQRHLSPGNKKKKKKKVMLKNIKNDE